MANQFNQRRYILKLNAMLEQKTKRSHPGLLVGGIALLIITSVTLGLFIGLIDPVEIRNELINETLSAAESTSMDSKVKVL